MRDAGRTATTGLKAPVAVYSGTFPRRAVAATLAALLLALPGTAGAGSVKLTWDPNPESDLKGYRLHYGLQKGNYTSHLDVGPTTTWPVEGLDETKTYFFAVTAYDLAGNESGPSDELPAQPEAQSPEAVSTPPAPGGPTTVTAGALHDYTTEGAISSRGHAVQYRFSWADGTASGWLPSGTTAAQKAWATAGVYEGVTVQARCASHTSVVSEESPPLTVRVLPDGQEQVKGTFAPSGPSHGAVGTAYVYEAGGAVSTVGDPVQYRFLWGDGTDSGWLPVGTTTASKSWEAAGAWDARIQARCSRHPSIVSEGPPLTVAISGTTGETVSGLSIPSGATGGMTWAAYVYEAGGATSSLGHHLHYRFHWGDGAASDWIDGDPAGAWHSWRTAGTYGVRVEAECADHPAAYALSEPLWVTVADHDPLVFSESFASTADWTSRWHRVSGRWGIRGRRMSLTSSSVASVGRILARPVTGLFAGRIEARFRLTKAAARAPNAGLIFAYRDRRHYRYVLVRGSRVTVGEVGGAAPESGPVSQAIPRRLAVARWHRVRLDLHPDGTAAVYLDGSNEPAIVRRFGEVLPGRVGFLTGKARSSYDDVSVWDGTVLPPDAPPASVGVPGPDAGR